MIYEPKFRAWHLGYKLMLPVIGIEWYTDTISIGLEYDKGELIVHPPQIVLMQWTGTYDDNKKEIFEGDIIKLCHNDLFFVEKKECVYFLTWDQRCKIGILRHRDKMLHDFARMDLDVVGNIYEHRELSFRVGLN